MICISRHPVEPRPAIMLSCQGSITAAAINSSFSLSQGFTAVTAHTIQLPHPVSRLATPRHYSEHAAASPAIVNTINLWLSPARIIVPSQLQPRAAKMGRHITQLYYQLWSSFRGLCCYCNSVVFCSDGARLCNTFTVPQFEHTLTNNGHYKLQPFTYTDTIIVKLLISINWPTYVEQAWESVRAKYWSQALHTMSIN